MVRRFSAVAIASIALCAATAASASASTINLEMNQNAAFSALGHWCGGIKEKVYGTGFAPNGYPQGNVFMETKCGGSGRGGGGSTTTYTGTATVVWTWLGETWKWGPMVGTLESKSAEDSHGDKLYNVTPCATGYHIATCAYLETGEPPYQPPAPPGNVKVSLFLTELGERAYPAMAISWEKDPERFSLITRQNMRAEPIGGSTAPVVEAERTPYFSEGDLYYLETNTLYKVTVTETDNEGTSAPSTPIEITTPNEDGGLEKEHKAEVCTTNAGKIALSPGITETPAVQSMTVSGEIKGCDGPMDFESGKYVGHLYTTEAITCSALGSATLEGTNSKSFSIKWLPLEAGTSKGSMVMPLSEAPMTGMSGTLTGGVFSTATSFNAASVFESFKGASLCGVPQGKLKVVKPVKSGTFSTSEVEFG